MKCGQKWARHREWQRLKRSTKISKQKQFLTTKNHGDLSRNYLFKLLYPPWQVVPYIRAFSLFYTITCKVHEFLCYTQFYVWNIMRLKLLPLDGRISMQRRVPLHEFILCRHILTEASFHLQPQNSQSIIIIPVRHF